MRHPAAPGVVAVCDLRAALVRLDGDEELLRMLISVFHEDAPQLLEQLDQGLQTGDLRTVERAAHNLKGLAANFDGQAARDAAFTVEMQARSGSTAGLDQAIAELHARIKRLRQALAE
ncbi:MAG: Hpt domain-containing protein [Pirellulales bacterium]|nr:Hpt domain-containing protein [Pirellulales bacterium]